MGWGWEGRQEDLKQAKSAEKQKRQPLLKIHMPGAPEGVFVELGESQINRKYKEERGARLILILDEVAELLQPSGVKTEAGKQEDQLKQEIVGIIQSLTQLGRSAGVHMVLCTQRNDAPLRNSFPLKIIRNGNKKQIKWEDLRVGDKFEDNSICKNIGEWVYEDCYKLVTVSDKYLDASASHLLQVIINDKETNEKVNTKIQERYAYSQIFRTQRNLDATWWCVKDLINIIGNYNIYNLDGTQIKDIRLSEKNAKCRCIQTNTGYYSINGFKNKNSIIPGVIQNNSLDLTTKLKVRRLKEKINTNS